MKIIVNGQSVPDTLPGGKLKVCAEVSPGGETLPALEITANGGPLVVYPRHFTTVGNVSVRLFGAGNKGTGDEATPFEIALFILILVAFFAAGYVTHFLWPIL